MGILDSIQSLAGQVGQNSHGDQAKVAGGFIQALTQHPEGIQGILNSFNQNGLAEHIGAWSNGLNATATPDQVQQGLAGTGLIEKTAEHAGVSPQVVQAALATVLPMIVPLRTRRPGSAAKLTGRAGNAVPGPFRLSFDWSLHKACGKTHYKGFD